MSGPINGVDVDSADAHDLLSHPLRYRVLLELSNHDNPVQLLTLADGIRSSEIPGAATRHDDTADSDAVSIELHHSHLPKLAAAGWIEYDPENRTVRYEPRIEIIQSALQTTLAELDQLCTAFDGRAEPDSR